MRFRICRLALALAVFLSAYCFLAGRVWSAAQGSASGTSNAAQSSGEVSVPPTATVTVPGPLRSFLRMAAISQKVAPEEILPLLARNVVVSGYSGKGRGRRPTEYLILLQGYLEQARELLELAGPEGVIHLSSCSAAQPLLTTLGYRLAQPCGANTSVETADPKRAFLTVDSGFPLADLEQTLRGGKPFAHPFPSSKVPVLFSASDWTALDRTKKGDVIDDILRDPLLARLYWALARVDENTRASLRQSPGLEKLLLLAPVLDFYGSHIHIRSAHLAIPGGTRAEPTWKNLVGASPDSPGDFVYHLLAKDEGWLAAYFDALSRVNSTQQSYFTEPHRLRRFYEALRGTRSSPGPARPVFRPDPGLLLLVTRLQLDPNDQPHLPGNLEVWREILGRKSHSKRVEEWARRASHWKAPDDLVEAMFALSRDNSEGGPLQVFLALSEIDRGRSPQQRLAPETVRLLAGKYPRFGDQYLIFTEFRALNDDSITRFLNRAEAVDSISDRLLRADSLGIFQANVGLWQILARQRQIPEANWNQTWQRVINPYSDIRSSAQLFDVGRSSLTELFRDAGGRSQFSQDEFIALLAGPKQTTPEGQQVRLELANRIHAALDAQHFVSLDVLWALGDGLNQMAQGKAASAGLIPLAGELREFQMPKPLFSSGERAEWAYGLYKNPHIQVEIQTDLTKIIKSPAAPRELAKARGQLVPFLRDNLVGLNYAYYEPPDAQMLLNNPLFVRSHDFSGDFSGIINMGEDQAWHTPRLEGRGYAASGGAHLAGSLADLPYVLAQVEQNFIVPENVQSLIWEDLVPSLLASAVLPRWWRVTRNELHAVALYQVSGEELLAEAGKNEKLRQSVIEILSDRMLPHRSETIEEDLRSGQPELALSHLTPADTFYLATEFRRRFPEEKQYWGKAGQELDELSRRFPEEVSWERLSADFGVPHPALAQTYAREFLNVKPFPTFIGYSSRLMAECWESNNLYWARLADESGSPPAMLHLLIPQLTHRMVEKIFATHLEDWPALLRALRETGEEYRQGKLASFTKTSSASVL
jgi:hypothetical protein